MWHWIFHGLLSIGIVLVWWSARKEIKYLSDELFRERQRSANKVNKITDLEDIIRRAGN